MKLSGYICVRNALRLDYCVRLAARSLLPVVDELVICDSDSTDGTRELFDLWAAREPKLRVINYPWPNPVGDSLWWVNWLNFARERLSHEMQITLDADEVLDDSPACRAAVREAAEDGGCRWFDRLNFWRDGRSVIPEGHCCGKLVARMGPAKFWMPSDEPHHPGECEILDRAVLDGRLRIFHLGFLRRTDAFYAKAKVVLPAFFTRYDQRLEFAERDGKQLHESECDFTDFLVPYRGPWPSEVVEWMRERGRF